MSDTLRSLLVEYGFVTDQSAMSKAEADLKASEARVTANQAAETKKREGLSDAENKQREEAIKKRRDQREAEFKQISEFTLKATALAAKVMAGVEAAAAPIFYTVDKAAASLEKLHYSAEISGGTVKGMNAFVYAVTQLGGSAENAQASFSKFSDLLKYKGFETALNNMGIATRNHNGEMLKSEDIITKYVVALKKYDRAAAEARGGAFGIDADTVNAARRPGLEGYEAQYRSDQAAVGNDPDANSAGAIRFERSSRRLKSVVGAVVDSATAKLFDQLQPQLDKFSDWIDQHGAQVADIIFRIANDIVKLAKAVLDELGKVNWDAILGGIEKFAKDFDKKAKDYFGETGSVAATFAAFGVLIGGRLLGPLKAVLETLQLIGRVPLVGSLLGVGVAAVAAGASAESTPGAGVPADATERAKVAAENKRLTDEANAKQGYTGNLLADSWTYLKSKIGLAGTSDDRKVKDDISTIAESTKKLADATDGGGAGGGGGGFGGSASIGDRLAHGAHHLGGGNWKGNYGQKGWWTDANQSHAVDYLMKNAGLTEGGAKALVARWRYVESPGGPTAVNPTSGAEGIAQWLGGRKGDGSSGSFDDQLGKVARELNGKEFRAKRILNTPGQEANGASAFERAEGWNPSTNTDNFTTRVREGMQHIVHGVAAVASPTAMAPAPAGTSDKAISDAEVFAARQRIAAGGTNPHDFEIVRKYLQQQNTAKQHVSALIDKHVRNGTLAGLTSPRGQHYALGDSPALRASISHSVTGDTSVVHNPSFVINTTDARAGMSAALMASDRSQQNLVRNMKAVVA